MNTELFKDAARNRVRVFSQFIKGEVKPPGKMADQIRTILCEMFQVP